MAFRKLHTNPTQTSSPNKTKDYLIFVRDVTTGVWEDMKISIKTIIDMAADGAIAFLGLSDTPSSYTGAADKILKVNSGQTAVEFSDKLASQIPQLDEVNTFIEQQTFSTAPKLSSILGANILGTDAVGNIVRNGVITPFDATVGDITTFASWAVGTTYAINAEVKDGGIGYISLQNSNVGHTPASSPLYWRTVTPQYSTIQLALAAGKKSLNLLTDITETVTWGNTFFFYMQSHLKQRSVTLISGQGTAVSTTVLNGFIASNINIILTGGINAFGAGVTRFYLRDNCKITSTGTGSGWFTNESNGTIYADNLTVKTSTGNTIRVEIQDCNNLTIDTNATSTNYIYCYGNIGSITSITACTSMVVNVIGAYVKKLTSSVQGNFVISSGGVVEYATLTSTSSNLVLTTGGGTVRHSNVYKISFPGNMSGSVFNVENTTMTILSNPPSPHEATAVFDIFRNNKVTNNYTKKATWDIISCVFSGNLTEDASNSAHINNKITGTTSLNGDGNKFNDNRCTGAVTLQSGKIRNVITGNTFTGGFTNSSGNTQNEINNNIDY